MTIYKNTTSKFFTKISFGGIFFLALLSSTTVIAQIDGEKSFINKKVILNNNNSNAANSTINAQKTKVIDTLKAKKDSLQVRTDTITQNESLKDKVTHFAEDYTEVNEKKKFIKLYNKAHIHYEDIDLEAGVIYIDYKKKEVYAGRILDSLGNLSQRPVFKQGNTTSINDSIRFNFDTKKALVWNTITTEGEFTLFSEVTKKFNDSVMFVKNVRFTTSKDSVNPEYYFLSKKAKIVPGKKIVIGSTQMWIEEVATPIIIPFGFFPLTKKRTSGFIIPKFAQSQEGFFLSDGGFYWAMSQYADLTMRSDIYTNGSYKFNLNSRYKKRYKFGGNMTFNYLNTITSERGLPDYSKKTNWNIIWRHSKDKKSSPLSSFSASVNFGSSKYYQNSLNHQSIANANSTLRNNMGSSVTYDKQFATLPINFTVSLNHTQNTNTEKINLSLPKFHLNVRDIYPFAYDGKKNNIFQKIKLRYTFDAAHKITTTDDDLMTQRMWNNNQMGAEHKFETSTNSKIFNYLNFAPSIKYAEVWQMQSYLQSWDSNLNDGNGGIAYERKNGLETFRNIDMSANLSTSIYGTYLFGDKHKIMGIRHTLNTSLNYSYKPIFDQYKQSFVKPDGEIVEYSIFDYQSMYGSPSKNQSKTLSLGFSNSFEAKIKTKDGKNKKIKFLTISSSYNFIADSLKLGLFSFSSSNEIIKGVNVNMRTTFDPYALNENGKQFNEYAITQGQGLGRFRGFSFNTGYRFDNKTFTKKSSKKNDKNSFQEAYNNPFDWNMNLSYTFNYSNKAYAPNVESFNEISAHTLSFKGSVKFTDNWQVGYASGYDLVGKGFTYSTFNFARELKSWHMSFTWVPSRNSWLFNIGIKSSMLQGIKYDKRKENFQQF
jgi:lipopolysaccharide assembly outer membrane protein LptD (OstA)